MSTESSSNAELHIDAAWILDRIRSSYYISAHEELRAAGTSYDRNTVVRGLNASWLCISDVILVDVMRILRTEEDHSLVISRWLDDDMVSNHFIVTFLRENAYRRGNPSLEKFHELFTRVYRTISGTQTIGDDHARTV